MTLRNQLRQLWEQLETQGRADVAAESERV